MWIGHKNFSYQSDGCHLYVQVTHPSTIRLRKTERSRVGGPRWLYVYRVVYLRHISFIPPAITSLPLTIMKDFTAIL